jgi:hypothetical protein
VRAPDRGPVRKPWPWVRVARRQPRPLRSHCSLPDEEMGLRIVISRNEEIAGTLNGDCCQSVTRSDIRLVSSSAFGHLRAPRELLLDFGIGMFKPGFLCIPIQKQVEDLNNPFGSRNCYVSQPRRSLPWTSVSKKSLIGVSLFSL